jgi:sulfite oxidase
MQDQKDPALIVRQNEPLNAGPPPELLAANAVTPTGRFFVRSHAPTPAVDPASFRLTVGGMVERALRLSLEEIHSLPKRTIAATIQCAGWRRRELLGVAPVPDELPWDLEAIGTAEWSGVPLALVLEAAGLQPGARHIALESIDSCEKEGRTFSFGSSIPLEKALRNEVLLAYEMNGQPLPAIHGGPLRLVVPGYIGARSVKWLGAVTVQAAPSDNHFQARAYRLVPPGAADGLMLGETPINAAILVPQEGAVVPAGRLILRGVALTGGERTVARVEVSPNGGASWAIATQLDEEQPYIWRRWERIFELAPGEHELVVRAWDSAANTMPERLETVWNVRGYMNNAWHRVRVFVER